MRSEHKEFMGKVLHADDVGSLDAKRAGSFSSACMKIHSRRLQAQEKANAKSCVVCIQGTKTANLCKSSFE